MSTFVERVGYGVLNWVNKFRKTDPDTSVMAAYKVPSKNIRLRMIELFSTENRVRGWTGHEVAARLDIKLNSITPRFAELNRLSIIKPSTARRDGQIVWMYKED